MAANWDQLGQLVTVPQLTGIDAVSLIGMIVKAASTARMHKKNCRKFAQHLKLIGNLLEQLKISELKKYPETWEPLEQLEDALRRSYVLMNSCQDRSYLYLLAMGWNIVHQFKRAQNEIDRYLQIVPLITLVDNTRVREKLENIERDKCEYTLDEEDKRVQDAILSRDPSIHDMMVLKKCLSCSYPNLPFDKALKKENEKLQLELQQSQVVRDASQREVIQRLLEATETVARSTSPASPGFKKIDNDGSCQREEWNSDLLDCCSEPILCMKTCFCPCGTFSKIATVANDRDVSPAEACNDLMAYSLVLSCCCYTCCVRRKIREMFNITGGYCDDFLSHLICCCCALTQEWREVEFRGAYCNGKEGTKTSPPPFQIMEC